MQPSSVKPRHVLCFLGKDESLLHPSKAVAKTIADFNFEIDRTYSQAKPDPHMERSFGVCWDRVFPKAFRKSRIEVDDQFLARVVPAILQNSPELKVADPANLLDSWLAINRELRRRNSETITSFADQTAPEILWHGAFKQLLNTAVEAGFADQRTYVYKGEDVDHQVHLGFDLASTIAAPVR